MIGKLKKRNDPEFTKKVIGQVNEKCGDNLDNLLKIKARVDKVTKT